MSYEKGMIVGKYRLNGAYYYRNTPGFKKFHEDARAAIAPLHLELVKDPTNVHDSGAIKVMYKGRQVAWVPKTDNPRVGKMMTIHGNKVYGELTEANSRMFAEFDLYMTVYIRREEDMVKKTAKPLTIRDYIDIDDMTGDEIDDLVHDLALYDAIGKLERKDGTNGFQHFTSETKATPTIDKLKAKMKEQMDERKAKGTPTVDEYKTKANSQFGVSKAQIDKGQQVLEEIKRRRQADEANLAKLVTRYDVETKPYRHCPLDFINFGKPIIKQSKPVVKAMDDFEFLV